MDIHKAMKITRLRARVAIDLDTGVLPFLALNSIILFRAWSFSNASLASVRPPIKGGGSLGGIGALLKNSGGLMFISFMYLADDSREIGREFGGGLACGGRGIAPAVLTRDWGNGMVLSVVGFMRNNWGMGP